MGSFTDRLWSVLGVNFLQTRLKWNVPGDLLCLYVCLILFMLFTGRVLQKW